MELPCYGLVTFTWGSVSVTDHERRLMVIKPSGVAYETMKAADMVAVDMSGEVVKREYRPSPDIVTHLEFYRRYLPLSSTIHTHPTHATVWAQMGLAVPALDITHADYFFGDVPCTCGLGEGEVQGEYELNTGKVIIEALDNVGPLHMSGIMVYQYKPFAWGKDAHNAMHSTAVMEEVAKMAWIARGINPQLNHIDSSLTNKYFVRKRGPNAHYRQKQNTRYGNFFPRETTGLIPQPFFRKESLAKGAG